MPWTTKTQFISTLVQLKMKGFFFATALLRCVFAAGMQKRACPASNCALPSLVDAEGVSLAQQDCLRYFIETDVLEPCM